MIVRRPGGSIESQSFYLMRGGSRSASTNPPRSSSEDLPTIVAYRCSPNKHLRRRSARRDCGRPADGTNRRSGWCRDGYDRPSTLMGGRGSPLFEHTLGFLDTTASYDPTKVSALRKCGLHPKAYAVELEKGTVTFFVPAGDIEPGLRRVDPGVCGCPADGGVAGSIDASLPHWPVRLGEWALGRELETAAAEAGPNRRVDPGAPGSLCKTPVGSESSGDQQGEQKTSGVLELFFLRRGGSLLRDQAGSLFH